MEPEVPIRAGITGIPNGLLCQHLFRAVLSPGAQMMLIHMASFVDDKGITAPSHAQLAAEARIEERSVRRQIADLIATGYLTIVEHMRGPNIPIAYKLVFNPER